MMHSMDDADPHVDDTDLYATSYMIYTTTLDTDPALNFFLW